jgi:hypothetical protein
MKNQSENELLSAYLDGELTPAERAEAERLLAESPAARRLLDELRALGSTLQSLPRHELGANLSARVLQDAARRESITAPARPRPRPFVGQIAERIKNNPRMVVWPLIVLSVAVLLMVFNADQNGPGRGKGNRDIARAPIDKNTENENRAEGATINKPKEGDLGKTEEQPSISAVKSPNEKPAPTQLVITKGEGGEKLGPTSAASRAGLIVISCQVSREVLQHQDYRQVFEANNIPLSDKPAGEIFQLTPAMLAEAAGVDPADLETATNAADANPKAKVIAVEITPAQLGGIINSLKSMPEKFRKVSINTPLKIPTQASSEPSKTVIPTTNRVLIVFRGEG